MKRLRKGLIIAGAFAAAAGAVIGLDLMKVIHPSEVIAGRYEVRGVDVSAYQGDIDWAVLSEQDISFAYIKATEGSGYTDDRFAENLKGALGAGLRVGAYHFFSYDSSGADQAANFIDAVPRTEGMLPPVIDVEFYGDYYKDPPDRESVLRELGGMYELLEGYYGTEPVIYCTGKAWRLYIKGTGWPLWIRDVYGAPIGKDWDFWQYRDNGELSGYSGDEKYIDLNVFRGTAEELGKYGYR